MATEVVTTDRERNLIRAHIAVQAIDLARADGAHPNRLFQFRERAREAIRALPEREQMRFTPITEPEGSDDLKPAAPVTVRDIIWAEGDVLAKRRVKWRTGGRSR